MDMLEDVQKEHEKEVGKLKKTVAALLDMVVSLINRNAELDEKRKKALSDYYETALKLKEAQGLIIKLTAQVNHNYENSSLPSSKCIGHEQTQKTYPAVTGRGRKTTVSSADPAEACSLSGQTEKQKGQAKQAHLAALTAAVYPYNRTLF